MLLHKKLNNFTTPQPVRKNVNKVADSFFKMVTTKRGYVKKERSMRRKYIFKELLDIIRYQSTINTVKIHVGYNSYSLFFYVNFILSSVQIS